MPFSTEPWLWEKKYCGWGWSLFPHGIFFLSSHDSATTCVAKHFGSQTLTKKNEAKTSCWFLTPIWNICASEIGSFPQRPGWKSKIFETTTQSSYKCLPHWIIFPKSTRNNQSIQYLSPRFWMTKIPTKKSKQTVAFTLLGEINNGWRTHNSTQNWPYRPGFLSLPMVCFGRHALKEIT